MKGNISVFIRLFAVKTPRWLLAQALLLVLFCGSSLFAQGVTLRVTSFTPTFSGFEAQFNRPLDTSVLNLYGTETGGFGPADVILSGAFTGAVRGSLVVDATSMIVFVKTAGPLQPDTYTVTLRSAVNGFRDLSGNLLDGNGDLRLEHVTIPGPGAYEFSVHSDGVPIGTLPVDVIQPAPQMLQ